MTRFEQFDRMLAATGWTYDPTEEVFRHVDQLIDGRESLALLPVMSLRELASYQEARNEDWLEGRL